MIRNLFKPKRLSIKLLGPLVLVAVVAFVGAGITIYLTYKMEMTLAPVLALIVALLIFFISLILIFTGFYVVRRVITPLAILKQGVTRLAQGNFETPIRINTGDEIEELAQEFNLMSVALFESQQSLADAARENAELYQDEQRRSQELALINRLNNTVLASLDVETTLDAVLRHIKPLLDYTTAEINLWDADTNILRAYAVGETGYTDSVGNYYSLDEGFTGWIATHRETLFIPNIEHFATAKPKGSLKRYPFQSFIGMPLMVGENFLGTIELVHTKINHYTAADVKTLTLLASQSAVAIRHAQLFQETQERAQAQEQLARIAVQTGTTLNLDDLLRQGMEQTVQALRATMGAVLLLNDDKTELVPHPSGIVGLSLEAAQVFRIATDSPLFEQTVFATRQPFSSYDAVHDKRILPFYRDFIREHNVTTVLLVPLTTAEETIGEMYILNKPTAFTRQDITFLTSVSSQLATAIQNIRLFDATQRNLNELSVLYNSAADLSATLSIEDVLDNLSRQMETILPADACRIVKYNEEADQLEPFLSQANSNELAPVLSLSHAPFIATALQEHKPTGINPNSADDCPEVQTFLQTSGYTCLFALPLVARNQSLGLIAFLSYLPKTYPIEDVNLAQVVANQAAIALQNALLYAETDQQLKLRLAELHGLQKVNKELNSTLVLDNILRMVVEEAVRATTASIGNVTLYDPNKRVFTMHVHVGWPDDAPDTLTTLTPASGVIGRVIRTGTPEIVSDTRTDPDYVAFPVPTRSQMVVPIQSSGIIEGIINLESELTDAFTPAQLSYVQALADQATIAIRNAQAYAEQVNERREASARVTQLAKLSEINRAFRANQPLTYILEEIAFAIQESIGFNLVLLSIVEQGQLRRITGAGIPLTDLNEIRQQRQPLEALEAMLQPQFRLSDSYFIPAEERDVWADKYNIIVLDAVLGQPAKDDPHVWQKEDLLLTPLKDAEGNIIGLLSVDAPVSGLRPDMQTITTLELFANQAATVIENSNLFEELQRHATHLKLSSQLSARISSILNPTELIGEVVNLIAATFNYYHVQIYQPDDVHPGQLVFQSGAGAANINYKDMPAHRHLPMDDSCVIGWVAHHQKPLLLNDVTTDARYLAVPHLPDTRSEMAVPITVAETLAGVLDIQHNQPNAFSQETLENMQTLADQLAVAVQNARLFDDALQREQLSSALGSAGLTLNATLDVEAITDVICEEAVSTFRVDAAFLWLTEGKLVKGVAGAGLLSPDFIGQTVPLDDPAAFSAQVIRQRRAQFINHVGRPLPDAPVPDPHTLQSIIGAPLVVRDTILGVLILLDYQTPNRFDIQDRISVTLFTNQAAISLENARLIDRLNRFTEDLEQRVERRTEDLRLERDRMDTLYKLARGLASSLDLDRILNEALGLLSQSIPITQGSILLVDDATGSLVYRAALGRIRGLPRGGQPTRYRMGVGLAGKILETREPLVEGNLPANKDWLPDGKPLRHHSVLGMPLVTGYEVVGVLMLFHSAPNYFTDDHLRLVKAAAPIIATAINNAGLYNLISEQVERLGVLLSTVRAEARKNEAIIKGIADGVLVLDDNQTIQLVNPAAATILGKNPGQLQNSRLANLLGDHPESIEERITHELHRIISTAQPLEGESSTAEDQPQPAPFRIEIENKVILVVLSTVILSTNAPPSTLVVLRDISREAELDRIKNEFISTVSHELRTPMTSIKGYTDLLASDKVGELSDMQRKFVQVIKNNADRLTALVNDILDISRIDTGRVRLDLQHMLLPPLIDSVITSLSTQIADKELSLKLEVPKDLPPIFADANRVTQILVNLVSNAVKYTRPKDSVTVSARATDKFVQIDVADTGLGIAEEDIGRVFNRFFRAERDDASLVGGTGLGLPIAKMFIEMMGGEIWVESELNKGTTFSFTLPLEDQRLEETDVVAAISNRRRILAVDDNIDILNLLKRNLEQEGYSVLTTLRGQRVLELAKKYRPALITLDIMLKDADGFDVLAQLKADPETKDIPVVIASVLADAHQRGIALGAAGYIVKPFEMEQVLETVSRLSDTLRAGNTASTVNSILVVDDDVDIVNWLTKELSDNGFSVTGAHNGADALRLAQTAPPDLVLLDMKMPGMDGFTVIEQLRGNPTTAKIPVIVITGSSIDSHSDTIKMLGLGASNLITKPFSLNDLVSEIKRLETPAGQPII